MKKHWYYIEIHECPVCSGGREFRERRYTRKPKDPLKRFRWVPVYDNCLGY